MNFHILNIFYLQEVDIVSLETLQTLLHAVCDVSTAEAHRIRVGRVHLETYFRGNDETISLLSVEQNGPTN